MHVLVVDDCRDTADALAWLLRSIGHEARTAYDGPSALLAADAQPPDVIIQDLQMPHMTGYEIARCLRQLPAGRHALLVAVTGSPSPHAVREAKEAGFDHLLLKPLGMGALEELLGAAAGKQASRGVSQPP